MGWGKDHRAAITTVAMSTVDQCPLPRKHKPLQALHGLNFGCSGLLLGMGHWQMLVTGEGIQGLAGGFKVQEGKCHPTWSLLLFIWLTDDLGIWLATNLIWLRRSVASRHIRKSKWLSRNRSNRVVRKPVSAQVSHIWKVQFKLHCISITCGWQPVFREAR